MRISEHIHALKIPFRIPVAPDRTLERFVYSYLVFSPEICLIDSGVAGSERLIFDYLRSTGHSPEEIGTLILTHAHPDHIGGAKAIRERCNCKILAHPEAQAWIENIDRQFSERPVPGFYSLVGGSVKLDGLLADHDTVHLGNLSLQVIHTPGHSQCSLSLFCPEEGVLFTGDAIPQPGEMPIYDDAQRSSQSISRLQKIRGILYLLASWDDPREGAAIESVMEKGGAYLQTIHQAVQTISDARILAEPIRLCQEMVQILGLPPIAVNPLVARSFSSHVKILEQKAVL